MDRSPLVGLDRATLVDGVTSDVHDATEGGVTDGDRDWATGIRSFGATGETLGT